MALSSSVELTLMPLNIRYGHPMRPRPTADTGLPTWASTLLKATLWPEH
jgi:hypothetical protein